MPIAVHADRHLVLLTNAERRRDYPIGSPRRITFVDLDDPGSGAVLPRRGAPVGAVIVPR
jgi:hypothetical protein